MDTVTLKYQNGSTVCNSTMDIIALRGLDDPDEVKLFPPVQNEYADGTIDTQIEGFRRVITVDFGVVQSNTDRKFIQNFLWNNERSITYGNDEVLVDVYDPQGFSDGWINNIIYGRRFTAKFLETSTRTLWPSPAPIVDNMIGYVISKVKVEQDETSPETFTTAVGKLATDDTGTALPSISLLTYAPIIIVASKQSSLIVRSDTITQSGTNIAFQMGYSLAGNAFSDGFFYADIAILLQTRP